jgi:hypothetical protein
VIGSVQAIALCSMGPGASIGGLVKLSEYYLELMGSHKK